MKWYEQNVNFLESEIKAMDKYYPQFSMETDKTDQSLFWIGEISSATDDQKAITLQVTYEENNSNLITYPESISIWFDSENKDINEQEFNQVLCTYDFENVISVLPFINFAQSWLDHNGQEKYAE